MAGYIGSVPVPQSTQTRDSFVATAGQTSFATKGYTPGFVDVFLNGIHLDPADFTATNGTDVVLASGATVNDVVTVIAFSVIDLTTSQNTAYDTLQVYSSGSGTYTVPTGVESIYVLAVGGGQGGGARNNFSQAAAGGFGGISGRFFSVSANDTFSYSVGTGGDGRFIASGTVYGVDGGHTTFSNSDNSITLTGYGGSYGSSTNGNGMGAGGYVSSNATDFASALGLPTITVAGNIATLYDLFPTGRRPYTESSADIAFDLNGSYKPGAGGQALANTNGSVSGGVGGAVLIFYKGT